MADITAKSLIERYYDPGGEYRPLSFTDLAARLGRLATDGDFGDPGGEGELAELPRPFQPPDIGGVALNPPTGERILVLN